jgi:hypothetical protein
MGNKYPGCGQWRKNTILEEVGGGGGLDFRRAQRLHGRELLFVGCCWSVAAKYGTLVRVKHYMWFTYIRSKDKRSNDKRPNDRRPKDKRSNDKRSNDRTSKDKRSKNTEHRMTERRIGPNVKNVQYFFTKKIFKNFFKCIILKKQSLWFKFNRLVIK